MAPMLLATSHRKISTFQGPLHYPTPVALVISLIDRAHMELALRNLFRRKPMTGEGIGLLHDVDQICPRVR